MCSSNRHISAMLGFALVITSFGTLPANAFMFGYVPLPPLTGAPLPDAKVESDFEVPEVPFASKTGRCLLDAGTNLDPTIRGVHLSWMADEHIPLNINETGRPHGDIDQESMLPLCEQALHEEDYAQALVLLTLGWLHDLSSDWDKARTYYVQAHEQGNATAAGLRVIIDVYRLKDERYSIEELSELGLISERGSIYNSSAQFYPIFEYFYGYAYFKGISVDQNFLAGLFHLSRISGRDIFARFITQVYMPSIEVEATSSRYHPLQWQLSRPYGSYFQYFKTFYTFEHNNCEAREMVEFRFHFDSTIRVWGIEKIYENIDNGNEMNDEMYLEVMQRNVGTKRLFDWFMAYVECDREEMQAFIEAHSLHFEDNCRAGDQIACSYVENHHARDVE